MVGGDRGCVNTLFVAKVVVDGVLNNCNLSIKCGAIVRYAVNSQHFRGLRFKCRVLLVAR